jgi:hypothetical protein
VLSLFSSRRNWDSPNPHPQASVPPPPPPTFGSGGGAHSLTREGVEESQFQRGDIHCGTLYMYLLCAPIPKCRLYWSFLFGWCSNFVGSESGQKKSVKLLQNMVYDTTQHHPPQRHTLSVYSVRLFWEGGEVREKVEGQQYTRGVKNTNLADCISSL